MPPFSNLQPTLNIRLIVDFRPISDVTPLALLQ